MAFLAPEAAEGVVMAAPVIEEGVASGVTSVAPLAKNAAKEAIDHANGIKDSGKAIIGHLKDIKNGNVGDGLNGIANHVTKISDHVSALSDQAVAVNTAITGHVQTIQNVHKQITAAIAGGQQPAAAADAASEQVDKGIAAAQKIAGSSGGGALETISDPLARQNVATGLLVVVVIMILIIIKGVADSSGARQGLWWISAILAGMTAAAVAVSLAGKLRS